MIWENRELRKYTTLFMVRAEVEAAVSVIRRSRLSRIRKALLCYACKLSLIIAKLSLKPHFNSTGLS